MILENKGKVWGTNENMSFYRFVPSSITNADDKDIRYYNHIVTHLQVLNTMFNGKYKKYISPILKGQAYKNFRYYILKFNPKALHYLGVYLKNF